MDKEKQELQVGGGGAGGLARRRRRGQGAGSLVDTCEYVWIVHACGPGKNVDLVVLCVCTHNDVQQ